MKNILKLSILSIMFAFASCKDNKTETVEKENTEAVTQEAVGPEEVKAQAEPLSKSSSSEQLFKIKKFTYKRRF